MVAGQQIQLFASWRMGDSPEALLTKKEEIYFFSPNSLPVIGFKKLAQLVLRTMLRKVSPPTR